jgi:hypothetical protein
VSTIFPKWTNHLPTIGAIGGLGAACAVIGIVWYYFTPKFWEVGYMPHQPRTVHATDVEGTVGFQHLIHAGKLGMDCRYCHSHVEESAEANIPPVSVCYGCHAEGHVSTTYAKDENVKFVRDAYLEDKSIEWKRVHKLPDYVRNFPHNVHLNAGVSCYSCHGMVPRMAEVHQRESLSMAWCLDCHRNPEPHLVPPEKVTDLFWVEQQLLTAGNPPTAELGSPGGAALLADLEKNALHLLPENCGACHY